MSGGDPYDDRPWDDERPRSPRGRHGRHGSPSGDRRPPEPRPADPSADRPRGRRRKPEPPDSGGAPPSGPFAPGTGGLPAADPLAADPGAAPRGRHGSETGAIPAVDPFAPDPGEAAGRRSRRAGAPRSGAPSAGDPYDRTRPRRAADRAGEPMDFFGPDPLDDRDPVPPPSAPIRDPYEALRPRSAPDDDPDQGRADHERVSRPGLRRPWDDRTGPDPIGGTGFDELRDDRDIEADDPLRRDLDDEPAGRSRIRPFDDADPQEDRGRRGGRRAAESDGFDEEPEDDAEAIGLPFDEDDEPEGDDEDDRRPRRGGGRRAARGSRGRRAADEGRRGTKKKRKRRSKAPFAAVLVLLMLLGGAGIGGYVVLTTYIIPPDFDGGGSGKVQVIIREGETGTAIGENLEKKGVVASARAFTNAMSGQESGGLTPGTYQLRKQMSAASAVELLLDPSARIGVRVTIREGLRSGRILAELAKKTDIPLADFKAAVKDTKALGLPSYAEKGAEGYLFPDTYMIEPGATAASVLKTMVDHYKRVAEEVDIETEAEKLDMDPNEVMSAAAIVQAESGKVSDMPKISRVVHNRLDIGMYLKMDSTCFYAIDEYGIAMNMTQQNACKASGSDYETYFREGLPAGPIVSPGEDAIRAALKPAKGEWLFFVATDPEKGLTEYAETEAEFQRLKEKFDQSQRGG